MDGYQEKYLKSKFGNSSDYQFDQPLQTQAPLQEQDQGQSQYFGKPSPEFSQGASRGAAGGVGSMLLSGGISSTNPYAAGGGLALMALEGDAKAKQAESEAKAVEAQQRKQAQLAQINNLMAISRGLSVTG